MSRYLDTFATTNGKIMVQYWRPTRSPLERNLYGHPFARLFWERQFGKILSEHGWEKVPNWECLFVHREKGLFLFVYEDDLKLAGKRRNIDPMWKVLNKQVDLEQPASFLDHVYLGCTQCEENTLTRHIFSYLHTSFTVSHVTLAQGVVRVMSSMFHVAVRSDLSSTLHFAPFQSLSSSASSSWSSSSSSMWVGSERIPLCASANEEPDSLVNNAPLTGYEPKFFDDYHFSETTEIFMQESSNDSRPSNSHDLEISDCTIGRALSSPLFTQEREEPAGCRQAYHSLEKVCCQVIRCLSVM